MDQKTRPTYYDGQYLGADDLDALVRYARTGQAQHALGPHVWGIGIGLELTERSLGGDDVEMVLTPGVAWDGYGRGLIAPAPQRLGLDRFVNYPDTDVDGIAVYVWLTYSELPSNPPGLGFACPDDDLHGSVVESFRIELRLSDTADTHSVSIASRSIDARKALSAFDPAKLPLFDESVPHQAFPDTGNNPRWPIFAGIVRWRKIAGAAGTLIKRSDLDLNKVRKMRRYVGAVAESIVAADGVLRLRDRSKDPNDANVNYQAPTIAPAGAVNDLVWCEGHLRVAGDARLQPQGDQDGKLDYRVKGGGDDGVPMYVRRTLIKTPIRKATLDAFLAPPAPPAADDAQTRFTVSTTDAANKPKECLTVVANSRVAGVVTTARVGVNQPDPAAQLHVHSDNPNQGDIQLFSATADFEYNGGGDQKFIFRDTGGVTAFVGGKIGVGTDAPAAKLQIDNPVQGHIQLFSATADFEYDGGDDQKFIFKDTGGTTAFLGGNVGIGTDQPLDRLHVAKAGHLNVVFDSPAFQEHLTAVVGSAGSGLRFSETNEFFVASQPFANRADGTFGNEHLRIKANGAVGLGTPAPDSRLQIHSSSAAQGDVRIFSATADFEYDGGSDQLFIFRDTGGTTAFLGGDIGIGTTTPTAKLDVNGDLHITGQAFKDSVGFFWLPSDATLKKDVVPLRDALDRLLLLSGVSFTWREPAKVAAGPGRYPGFIAQDVEKVFPEWVLTTPAGVKAINPVGLDALVVEALRELNAKCERLEAEVADLRARVGRDNGAASPRNSSTKKPRQRRYPKKKAD
jgi:hypothetical protein